VPSLSLLLVLSSLHSLSSLLLLLLLLLRAVLVLAPADGAAWVRAALVRDLVLRTSYPSCSSVSCWDALTCSKALKLPPPWPLRLLPTQLPPHPHQGVALGGGGPGGGAGGGPGGVSLITGSDQKRYINKSRVNPAG